VPAALFTLLEYNFLPLFTSALDLAQPFYGRSHPNCCFDSSRDNGDHGNHSKPTPFVPERRAREKYTHHIIMANGYVPRFMRPNPFLQRAIPLPPSRPSSDPAALFAQAPLDTEQCMFPEAFPAQGPNIIQRFWIRLLGPPVRGVVEIYRGCRTTWAALVDWTADLPTLIMHTHDSKDTRTQVQMLILALYDNSWSLIIGLVVIIGLSVAAWLLSPKGENQTYAINRISHLGGVAANVLGRIWRSSLILSFVSCYIMWGKWILIFATRSVRSPFHGTITDMLLLSPCSDHILSAMASSH